MSDVDGLMKQYPEQFKKIGAISYIFNRIDVNLITMLSMFFYNDANPQPEKNAIFIDALLDISILGAFKAKRKLVEKVIRGISRVALEKSLGFDETKWLGICKSIEDVQELRNKLAHRYLSFLPDGKVGFAIRKKDKVRLNDARTRNDVDSMERTEIDLDEELKRCTAVCTESEKFLTDFFFESRAVLSA